MSFFFENQENVRTNPLVHSIYTRNKHHLHRPVAKVSCFQKGASYSVIRICSSLPRCIVHLKPDGSRAETRFRRNGRVHFKSARASVQSNTGSQGGRISVSNAGYTTFRGSVKSTGYTLHSPVSPSLPLSCVTVCHHISNALYYEGKSISKLQIVIEKRRIWIMTYKQHLFFNVISKQI